MPFSNIEDLYGSYLSCNNQVSTDTRSIPPGSIFFCLKGANFNGNDYALEALEKGAQFVVSDEERNTPSDRILLVPDVLDALQKLASYHKSKIKTHILGIGGSNGKTTTKELCTAVTSPLLRTKATKGNLNNHIGVPLTLLDLDGSEDLAIVEMGTNHPGEMEVLCNITNPDSGIVTNVGKEHLEGFGDLEGVAREESVLYQHLLRSGGKALINVDDHWLAAMHSRIPGAMSYGIKNDADLRGEVLQSMPHLEFQLHFQEKTYGPYLSPLGGNYNLYNILSAVTAGLSLGLDIQVCAQNACTYQPQNNRSEWHSKGDKKIWLDAYNANPSSMEAALVEFAALPGRKAVFLGDMLEMGAASHTEHSLIFELSKQLGIDEIYLCGEAFSRAAGSFPSTFKSAGDLLFWLQQHPSRASYALVKGSRGMKMEQILEAL
jgi:UDP-N-acetylmuramoyl-tripeptide--D-alanyl-D-alanine ligase